MLMENIEKALASEIDAYQAPLYDGFQQWRALLVKSQRERHAAEWLIRAKVSVYLPTFTRQVHRGRNRHYAREDALISGMLFAPLAMIERLGEALRKQIFDLACVFDVMRSASGIPTTLLKADIELIREMEAIENLPQDLKAGKFKVAQKVRFKDGSKWQAWIGGTIFEIVDFERIGIDCPHLFGGGGRLYVPAFEIEADVTDDARTRRAPATAKAPHH